MSEKTATGMLPIDPEGAFLIFDKLATELPKPEVLCAGSFRGWSLLLRGTVAEASRQRITLFSSDGASKISLRLDMPGLAFAYSEPKDLPSPLREEVSSGGESRSGLVIAFPSELAERATLAFIELRRGEVK
jgi:hypothetical protein